MCSMRLLEIAIVLIAMLFPFFGMKSYNLSAYIYWIVVTAIYLTYISLRRWELE